MAIRYAIANGNWSSTATWDNGASLGIPTTGDDVFSNNRTVNIDQSFEVAILRSTATTAEGTRLNAVMTSNTSPSGIVNASGNSGDAWRVFNGSTGGAGSGWDSGAVSPQWVQYQFESSLIIRSYSIFYPNQATNQPTSFNLQGSNDGVSFVTLDTRTSYVYSQNAWNTFTISTPTTAYSYYRLNITAVSSGNVILSELTFNDIGASVVAGGSFNFNSGSISGSVTSTSPLSPGATNLITVTATTGTVGLTLGGNITPLIVGSNIILHSGNCNFNVIGTNIIGRIANDSGATCINKTSAGTITITANLIGGTSGANSNRALSSTNGNTVVIGNVAGGQSSTNMQAIFQSAGTITVTGNVTGGVGNASCQGISFSGTAITVNGNLIGGATAAAIDSTAPVIVTGNVTGSGAAGITTTAPVVVTGNVVSQGAAAAINAGSTATFINISGSVISSAAANAITATNASAVVNLAGNMVNTSGKTAIYCQNLFLSDTATTQAQFFTIGSQDRTLYSADTFPSLPSVSDVRFGTTYGPGSGNTGTLRMASPQDVRSGVLTDNTTGSAILSMESLSNEIQTSSDPFAQRLRNISTVDVVGNLLTAFKK